MMYGNDLIKLAEITKNIGLDILFAIDRKFNYSQVIGSMSLLFLLPICREYYLAQRLKILTYFQILTPAQSNWSF